MSVTVPARSWGAIARSIFLALLTTSLFAFGARTLFFGLPTSFAAIIPRMQVASVAAIVQSPFEYTFQAPSVLDEAGKADDSSSPYFWLNSGAHLITEDGVGKTVQGSLPILDAWRFRYSMSSNTDTNGGYAPQNLFRLLTRSNWESARIDISFRIIRDSFTESPNRNESNGVLLMSRYKNGDNLYYAGLRVDGHAVIKKKVNGTYFTMAEKSVFEGEYKRENDMNLIPHNEWIALRSETVTAKNGTVTVKLFMKKKEETKWTLLLSATDDGKKYENTQPIIGSFPVGIRTDFMDVEFDDLRIENI